MSLDTGEAVGKGEHLFTAVGSPTGVVTLEVSMEIPRKAEIDLLLDPAVLTGLYMVLYKCCLYVHCCISP